MTVRGIDVSRWQGNFGWRTRPGLQFGMCKATEGTGLADPEFGHNWDGMWSYRADHRMPRFAYHFLHPALDPAAQAEFFIATVKRHGLLPGDNLVLDHETADHLPAAEVARCGVAFLRHVNALAPDHRVMTYTYPAFAREGNCAGMGAWHLWIANYLVAKPAVPQPWERWDMWQDGDSPVDTDQFNGTGEQLLAFTRMPDKR